MSRRPLWSTWRKAWGNLLPLVLVAGPFAMALREAAQNDLGWRLILWTLTTLIVGWASICVFGLAGNKQLKEQMTARLHINQPHLKAPRWFVGFARPKYRGLLDAHEDVGFLILHADRAEFAGDQRQIELPRASIEKVIFRANPHTLLGLGRWISIEAIHEGKPVRMLIEPREKMTLLGNMRFSRQLRRDIQGWLKGEAPLG